MKMIRTPLPSFLVWLLVISQHPSSSLLPKPLSDYGKSSYFSDLQRVNEFIPKLDLTISEKDVNKSLTFSSGVVERMQRLESNLGSSDIKLRDNTPAHAQYIDSFPENTALKQAKHALIVAKATTHLISTHCYRNHIHPIKCARYLTKVKINHDMCDQNMRLCLLEEKRAAYRSPDGACNNEDNGSLGKSFTTYERLVYPSYLDGVYEMRRSVNKKSKLPSTRLVTTSLLKDFEEGLDNKHTVALMEWGEFIGNDLVHTVTNKMIHSGSPINCCEESGSKLSPRYLHPFCAPISISNKDEFYSKSNTQCLTYVRSVPGLTKGCTLGPVEQLNQATHFLDASHVYGNDANKTKDLRMFSGGEMKTLMVRGREFPPLSKEIYNHCHKMTNNKHCFEAGDTRINSEPHLTAMHTLWLREHNRVAKMLAKLNPAWNDEILFQEARKIVIAEIQHITYSEWLPKLLDEKYMKKIYDIGNYNGGVDPSISNSFATAAFRFMKSLVSSNLNFLTEERKLNTSLNLGDHFNNPDILEEGEYFDSLVRGLATQNCQKADFEYVPDVVNLGYGDGKKGMDIISLDIQRGRDHGLPSYMAFRTVCGLPHVSTFDGFLDVIPEKAIKTLSQIYKSPQDVDLLVGGMLEMTNDESLLGPTFSCVIADQFLRSRSGDRYFYNFDNQPKPFTKEQLVEIQKSSLGRIFCDNGDGISTMQKDVFLDISKSNGLLQCNGTDIPKINLEYWRI